MFVFVVLGGAIVVFLGAAHAVFTLQSSPAGGPMAPTSPDVRAAMDIPGGLGLAPEISTTLWRAWAGFNLSHSLGVVAGGLFTAIPALVAFDAALDNVGWVVGALALPPLYLALSIRYWFDAPTRAISLATVLIWVGVIGGLVG